MPRDPDAAFIRAQKEYENREPPDWDGVDSLMRECTAVLEKTITNPLGFEVDVDYKCDFMGKVDVYYAGPIEFWTCPKCGTEHEVDIEED